MRNASAIPTKNHFDIDSLSRAACLAASGSRGLFAFAFTAGSDWISVSGGAGVSSPWTPPGSQPFAACTTLTCCPSSNPSDGLATILSVAFRPAMAYVEAEIVSQRNILEVHAVLAVDPRHLHSVGPEQQGLRRNDQYIGIAREPEVHVDIGPRQKALVSVVDDQFGDDGSRIRTDGARHGQELGRDLFARGAWQG